MKALLVTGGCGFIGSNFIRRFLSTHSGWKILNLDKLTYCGNRENTREWEGRADYEFMEADICDEGAVNEAVERSEAVIHFAAETHVDRSIDNANDFLLTNVMGTRTLLDAARRQRVKRFIHISTDEVYGSIESGYADENAPLRPSSPYSASKAAADLLVQSYRMTYQFPAIIVRSTNNFGPSQFPEKIIPLFITNLLEGKKVPLYAKGANRRDWIFVEDNCRAIELIFDKGRDGEIYNVGGGNEMTNRELTEAILQAMNQGTDKIQSVEDRPGHDFRYGVDTAKIQKMGFKPQRTFQDALGETIEWYKQHAAWWRRLKRDKYTLK